MARKKTIPLEEELTVAIEDAVVGEILRPSLAGRLKTIARAILLRRGHGKSQISVRQVDNGFEVEIFLQRPGARVQQIHLRFGSL
jgi:hypothetical protein